MTTIAQRSFAGGELTPALAARVDQVKYATGLSTLLNWFVMRQGGASNRPGTKFVGEVKDGSTVVRVTPFRFNDEDTYILQWGHLNLRFIFQGEQVVEGTKVITAITTAAQAVVTSVAHGYANGNEVVLAGIVGMVELNGRNVRISDVAANSYKMKYLDGTYVDSTAFGAYVSGGTSARIYEIATPYAAADVFKIHFVESADVILLAHQGYKPQKLIRTAHTSWAISDITFAPEQAAPTGFASSNAGPNFSYAVTAINDVTREESLPLIGSSASTSATLTWTPAAGATEYNIYRALNAVYGFIGVANGGGFTDTGIIPDTTDTPPTARNPFSTDYPATVALYQQRTIFANTPLKPETVYTSKTGAYYNYTTSSPLQDDDAATFALAGNQVNPVRWLIGVAGELIAATASGEWSIEGSASGTLLPQEPNPKQQSYNGATTIQPIIVGGSILYIQARSSIIRDLAIGNTTNPFDSKDLTVYSSHLFDGHTIVDWAFQKVPHSIVWCVRDDGVLLGLTYVREHELWAWHRHTTDGLVESVASIPEGNYDALYAVVKRTVDGNDLRYVERFTQRDFTDIKDAIFMDSSLTYDGRNTGAGTMTLTGSGWTYTDTLTMTASVAEFGASDVGNAVHLRDAAGGLVICSIVAYTSPTVVSVQPDRNVPASLQAVATTSWGHAIKVLRGLWHLEGKDVAAFGDGFVISSPLNTEESEILTVTDGVVTLPEPYVIVHAGLPYLSDLKTLDIDTAQGESMADKKKNVGQVTLFLQASRGLFVGSDDSTDLTEVKLREDEDYDAPVSLVTGKANVILQREWNSTGRILVRQVDPLPAQVLAVVVSGFIPVGR